MKVFIDTNVLISAALNPDSVPFHAYVKATSYPNHGIICEQNIDEMRRVFKIKLPKKLSSLERFLEIALLTLELVPVPTEEQPAEKKIRDIADRTLFRAAFVAGADIIVIGDKDLLESGIIDPEIMTLAEFMGFLIICN